MEFAGSIIVAAFVAVFSVILTMWFYQKRDKINTLRAIKSEIEQNREIGDTIHSVIEREEKSEEGAEVIVNPPQFTTHSFQNAKNLGILDRISSETRNILVEHYTLIENINHQLQYRQQTRSGAARSLTNYEELKKAIDQFITFHLKSLRGEIDSKLKATNRSNFEESDPESFDNVEEAVKNEIGEYRILTLFF